MSRMKFILQTEGLDWKVSIKIITIQLDTQFSMKMFYTAYSDDPRAICVNNFSENARNERYT